jgi:hypothetical protein
MSDADTIDNSVRPIPDVADHLGDLRGRFIDVCERQVRVCVRFRTAYQRGAEMGVAVGVVAAVDSHARLVISPRGATYNVWLGDVTSVVELE